MAASLSGLSNSPMAVAGSASPVAQRVNQPPGTKPGAGKLAKAAQEFEAILLASWLEKMNQGFVGTEENQDAAHDTVSSLGTEAIASALAARGGIGLARMLVRQLLPASAHSAATAASESPQPSRGLKVGEKTVPKD